MNYQDLNKRIETADADELELLRAKVALQRTKSLRELQAENARLLAKLSAPQFEKSKN